MKQSQERTRIKSTVSQNRSNKSPQLPLTVAKPTKQLKLPPPGTLKITNTASQPQETEADARKQLSNRSELRKIYGEAATAIDPSTDTLAAIADVSSKVRSSPLNRSAPRFDPRKVSPAPLPFAQDNTELPLRESEPKTWTRDAGQIAARISIYCATTPSDANDNSRNSTFVAAVVSNGSRSWLVERANFSAFAKAHFDCEWIFHGAADTLRICCQLCSEELDLYKIVDQKKAWDVGLLFRLYSLATAGDPLGEHVPLSVIAESIPDSELSREFPHFDEANEVGIPNIGDYLGQSLTEIPATERRKLATTARVIFAAYVDLRRKIEATLRTTDTANALGFVSRSWLTDCENRFGPLTHHVQLRASIVLREMSRQGVYFDGNRREEVLQAIGDRQTELRSQLKRRGYQPDQSGAARAMQEILQETERRNPNLRIPRTAKRDSYSQTQEVLNSLGTVDPFFRALAEYRELEHIARRLEELGNRERVHPSFNTLVRTGRTSSYGALNSQNILRNPRFSACIVPPPGIAYVHAYYQAIELVALAQLLSQQFNLQSQLAELLNKGIDPHAYVAARMLRKPMNEVTTEERQRAKLVNLGLPVGMSDKTLRAYAKTSFGVELTQAQATWQSAAWHASFPEMRSFLGSDNSHDDRRKTGERIAALFELTPRHHKQATRDWRFFGHRNNRGHEDEPLHILGNMFLKALQYQNPRKANGQPFSQTDVEFLWQQAAAHMERIPPQFYGAVCERKASPALAAAVRNLVVSRGVFTATGRLRAKADYCARLSTTFEGLAADGAKIALWRLWRAGFQLCNFAHDEIVAAVPEEHNLEDSANQIREIMIASMREVTPAVQVAVTTRSEMGPSRRFRHSGNSLAAAESSQNERPPTGPRLRSLDSRSPKSPQTSKKTPETKPR